MANPRQRRKGRSSYRKVSQSLRSRKNMKKPPPVRGPKALQDAWDPKKTVRQNYAAMGLLDNLNPTTSGGIEHRLGADVIDSNFSRTHHEDVSEATPNVAAASILKGHGRIIKDASGNIVDIELADEDMQDDGETPETPMAEEEEWRGISQQSDWVKSLRGGRTHSEGQSQLVQNLERIAAATHKSRRFTSVGERSYLERLVNKHGSDVDAMARDAKLNVDQKTVGQLRKALVKAGLAGRGP